MDTTLIRKRIKELLTKVDEPKEFTKELQEFFKSSVDEIATKNYRRIIPETRKFYGVPKPVLGLIASEIGKFIQKEPAKPLLLA